MEWNIFKKTKNETIATEEKSETTAVEKPSIESKVNEVGIRLESLLGAVNALGDKGLEALSEKDFDTIIMQNLGENWEDFINNIKFDHDASHLLENFNTKIKEIALLKDSAKNEDSAGFIMKAQEKLNKFGKSGRVAIVLGLMALKFAVPAMAGESKKTTDNADTDHKTEIKAETHTKGGDGKTLSLEPEDFEGRPMEKLIDFSNSFETDSHIVSEKDNADIKKTVNSFLGKITPANYNDVINGNWEIEGSSDERPTNAYKGGNQELTEKRIDAAKNIFEDAIKTFDFSDSKLSAEQIKALQNKAISEKYPQGSEGREAGVTYITDLFNPATGEKYTSAEVEKIKNGDQEEYKNLLEKCRFTRLNLDAPTTAVESNLEKPGDYDKKIMEGLDGYERVVFLIDNSYSMADSRHYIADNILKNLSSIKNVPEKVSVGFFSNNLQSLNDAKNMADACKTIKNSLSTGNSYEKTLGSTITALEKISDQNEKEGNQSLEKTIVKVATDEAIQDASVERLEKIQDLAAKNNIDVKFLVGIDESKRVIEVSVDELLANVKYLSDKENNASKTKTHKLTGMKLQQLGKDVNIEVPVIN